MSMAHDIQAIDAEGKYLHLVVDGKTYHLLWQDCSPRLAIATPSQRKHFDVSPAGYGIRWPEIDEDLAITPLIEKAEEYSLSAVKQVREKKGKYRTR